MSVDLESDDILRRILDAVDDRESQVLAWGLTTGQFSEDELEELIQEVMDARRYDARDCDELLEALVERALVVREHTPTGPRYRSRAAETMRLLSCLRQLFPRHLQDHRWLSAPTLVADYRYMCRPREYPRRDVTIQDALTRVDNEVRLGERRRAAMERLLTAQGPGTAFESSEFQLQATADILRALDAPRPHATIVGAGTGSGKTLAFYLPALSHLAALVGPERWTKALAIYPRKELLADQATEALAQIRRLNRHLQAAGKRGLTLGAFYSDTPFHSGATPEGWPRTSGGRVCTFLRCPDCAGRMVWRDDDRVQRKERLRCEQPTCATMVGPEVLVLSRRSQADAPPDVLFTTTESLNRQLGNGYNQHVFGIGPRARRKPQLMLLDEVHTYEGVHGAQVALLLRRWRHAVGKPIRFVGLSATLREADRFFGELVGLDPTSVRAIEPRPEDFVREGREYLVAVRGDPVSGSSLLSTTIQTTMLMRRVLEPTTGHGELYGSKVFVFTDDLDVTNRMFFNIQDAEGLDSWGRPRPNRPLGSLANLRSSDQPDFVERRLDGQAWTLAEQIGHELTPGTHLRIGRTSSQDAGVVAGADVVVATASLEVGFNDPTVGAVIQHKAPHDAARFLQRKGRAGRQRTMRPWTVVVLSDYGRDRLTYQAYDLLFDPVLMPRTLPIANRYVQRMQAAFAFMEWLAGELAGGSRVIRRDLAAPETNANGLERQRKAATVIESVLSNPARQQSLAEHLAASLKVDATDVQALMWEPPRALMTAVLPTTLRRLRSAWRRYAADGTELVEAHEQDRPLPEFVPTSLFSDLMLPEIEVVLPAEGRAAQSSEWMPIAQALREFAPGRVSRRFGVRHEYVRHWLPVAVDSASGEQQLVVQDLCTEFDELGIFHPDDDPDAAAIACVRPRDLRVSMPPRPVRDMSHARMRWQTQILAEADGADVEMPRLAPWRRLAAQLTFFTSNRRASATVRRFAPSSQATVALEQRDEVTTHARFIDGRDGEPVALGFALDVDGLRLRLDVPSDILGRCALVEPAALRSFRTSYFDHLIRTSSVLGQFANEFQRGWLSQVYLSAILARAVSDETSVEEAARL